MSKLRVSNAYARELVKRASELGWEWRMSGGGHLQFNRGALRVTASGTPRCPGHAIKKTLSRLRRLNACLEVTP
jgi:hypothetical protein